ncbi:superantigen-like protein [Staphylococcus agnetis]|uniref:exotoxin beta-grasp domain-containing protein n=1 Tax=Staphylococcus agnetis TaxID=985762 RepID=UPI00208F6AD4|nr:superantigen-like protein [Staphylococcus agnetis]MCO4356278.1 superantigen-like protein [Staphylococcus agnetis]MCO4365802.1 superantigen-like protein [Staphylococcus agnetis]
MKLSTIAKTSLALGILTTGVMTTYAQSVDSEAQASVQTKISTEDLKTYYSKKSFELKKVKGDREGNIVKVIDRFQLTNVKLIGKDIEDLKSKNLSNIDVFVVKENNSKFSDNDSIGGITKASEKRFVDWSINPTITLKKSNGIVTSEGPIGTLPILKDKVTLKELDFKLRNKLINENGLYSNGNNSGVITVRMKDRKIDNDYYSFVLDNKLQEHRMGDVIDATQIDRIDVEYK